MQKAKQVSSANNSTAPAQNAPQVCNVSEQYEHAGALCGMPARMLTWGVLPAGETTWSPWHTP